MTDTFSATATLLAQAAQGDQRAWNALVDEHSRLLWSVARSFRLDAADANDVVQTTWLRLLEHLDRIEDPSRLVGWLVTTARREAMRVLRRSGRERPVVEDTVLEADKIAARVTWHGTHRGDFVGIPGTGVAVTMQSVQILKFTDGLVTDWWGTADVFGVLRQVGASVAPPA